jgi:hypothetical protein
LFGWAAIQVANLASIELSLKLKNKLKKLLNSIFNQPNDKE